MACHQGEYMVSCGCPVSCVFMRFDHVMWAHFLSSVTVRLLLTGKQIDRSDSKTKFYFELFVIASNRPPILSDCEKIKKQKCQGSGL